MITVTMGRLVRGSPERIWEVIDDVERMSEWFAFADGAELLEGVGLGRRQRTHGRWSGKAAEVDQEVTLYEPTRAIGWRHLEERLDGRPAPKFAEEVEFTVRLAEEPGGTRVTHGIAPAPGRVSERSPDTSCRAVADSKSHKALAGPARISGNRLSSRTPYGIREVELMQGGAD